MGREADFERRRAELDRANRRHKNRRYPSLLLRWLASSLSGPKPVDVGPLPDVAPSQLSLTFVGHSSILLRYSDLTIAMDPMVGSRLGLFGLIRRDVAPGVRSANLASVDVVLISCDDPAHLHVPTLRTLPRTATVVVPPGHAAKLGGARFDRVIELTPGQSFSQAGVDIYTTPVVGDGGLGFAIRGDGPTVFACGRTGYGPHFRDIGLEHHPDLAILPIGGYHPRSFRARHLSPLDALYAFEDLRSRIFVPIRFGAFPLSYERLGEPSRWLDELVRERNLTDFVVPLAVGESRLFTNPRRAKRPTPHQHLGMSDLAVSAQEIADNDADSKARPGSRTAAGLRS